MENIKEKGKVFQLHCPCCHALLWIDPVSKQVIQSEKVRRKKGSLEELLLKDKKKREAYDRKFQATAELEKQRRKKVQEKFEKAFTEVEKDD
ncbi:MAG: hypothetical protein ACE5L7_06755 [Candidatus Aminicenantales bacterium]